MKRQFKKLITFTKDYQNKEDIILRDHLAMERTKLANERTLLSYLRASLYLLLGGIALLGLKDFQDLKFLGYIALSLSALLIIVGTIRFLQLKKQLERFYVPINNDENN
jgi:putative membrane protein|tara:strand:- start:28446 stop:28772 length:327 start_codon:yes stop_codon:yes gene_type:complete